MRRWRIVLSALLLCLLALGAAQARFESRFGDRSTIAAHHGDLALAQVHDDGFTGRRPVSLNAIAIDDPSSSDHLGASPLALDPDLRAEVGAHRRVHRHIPRMKAGDPPSA